MKSIITFLRLNRRLLVGSVVVAAVTGFAAMPQAQSPPSAQQTSRAAERMRAAERNGRSVARTGATVPNPGTAKTGPQTEIERRAKERSNRTIRTICSGCL
jgi:hypothetical protein